MTDKDKPVPTWGYRSGEEPRIFDLKPGEKLPNGWHDTPQPDKPAKRAKDSDGDGE